MLAINPGPEPDELVPTLNATVPAWSLPLIDTEPLMPSIVDAPFGPREMVGTLPEVITCPPITRLLMAATVAPLILPAESAAPTARLPLIFTLLLTVKSCVTVTAPCSRVVPVTLRLFGTTTLASVLVPLTANSVLQSAAIQHSTDMVRNNFFSHDSSSGEDFEDRILRFRYPPPA